jgi:hypothetical protein
MRAIESTEKLYLNNYVAGTYIPFINFNSYNFYLSKATFLYGWR